MAKQSKGPGGNFEVHYKSILGDISHVVDAARKSAARSVNCTMTAAYWLIGRRIVESEQKGLERADYGEELLKRLSIDLTSRYGRGFAKSNLYQVRSFYVAYRQALTLIHEQSAKLPVSEDTVLKLHRLTRGDIWDAGKYKEKDGISRIRAASRSTSEPQGREN